MVDLPLRFELGGQEQFTLATSVALDENPLFFIKDPAGTLVYSSTGAASGSGHYYEYATVPSTKGLYTAHWLYAINNQSFYTVPDVFEVVQTLAYDTTGQYCNYSDVVNLYEPMRDMRIAYHEIDDKIADVQARIDAKLARRYAVPFATDASSLPPVIKTITKNLTLIDIYRQGRQKFPDWMDSLKTEISELLDSIADGETTLVLSDGTILAQTIPDAFGQVEHNLENYVPTMNMLDWETQQVDSDRLDDEEDDL